MEFNRFKSNSPNRKLTINVIIRFLVESVRATIVSCL